MEVEGIRIIADWLSDPTNGVNALLAGVPRYAGHSVPPNVTIYNEIERIEVARRAIPVDVAFQYPALCIYEHKPVSIEGHVQTEEQDATVDIAICYAVKKSDTKTALQDARYTMRAVRRSLVRLNDTIHQGTLGMANNVNLIEVQSLSRMTAFADMDDAIATLTLVATIVLRDYAPRG